MEMEELKARVQEACYDMAESEAEAALMSDDPEIVCDLIGDIILGEPNRDALICQMLDEGGAFERVAERMVENL